MPGSATPDQTGRIDLTQDAARQIAALTAELQEREQLIETLTERLEEAAEQLDRVHRSGGDRALRGQSGTGGGAGLPSQMLEQHLASQGRLESFLQEWEDVQGASLLRRVDSRLEKLIEILRSDSPAGASAGSHAMSAAVSECDRRDVSAESVEQRPDESPAEEAAIALPDPPLPVAADETCAETLQTAVNARDMYITYLIRELRSRRPNEAIDWEAIRGCPEEFEQRLQALEQQLQQNLQREELSISLERAKLGRERAELDRIRTRLDREIRQFGHAQHREAAEAPSSEESDNRSTWRSLFGKRN